MRKTVLQLAAERIADVKWKRSAVMELLQFDLFKWYFKRHSPDFATFFANSTCALSTLLLASYEAGIVRIEARREGAAKSTKTRFVSATSVWIG